ncbi:pollen-specific leucine-rich repeat extensin-like protein 1 [Penaeus chinensis]|uniref:pollen-specific leucine-rich repeat extensin-like protein 1 n=1 Tax=Penaeus chinensis TaxID=139456 RepID=UPI001FB686A8|nr:pollen-specific leucine-rich repeat extensin-like protein 1 [Penaeus chinensis]
MALAPQQPRFTKSHHTLHWTAPVANQRVRMCGTVSPLTGSSSPPPALGNTTLCPPSAICTHIQPTLSPPPTTLYSLREHHHCPYPEVTLRPPFVPTPRPLYVHPVAHPVAHPQPMPTHLQPTSILTFAHPIPLTYPAHRPLLTPPSVPTLNPPPAHLQPASTSSPPPTRLHLLPCSFESLCIARLQRVPTHFKKNKGSDTEPLTTLKLKCKRSPKSDSSVVDILIMIITAIQRLRNGGAPNDLQPLNPEEARPCPANPSRPAGSREGSGGQSFQRVDGGEKAITLTSLLIKYTISRRRPGNNRTQGPSTPVGQTETGRWV